MLNAFLWIIVHNVKCELVFVCATKFEKLTRLLTSCCACRSLLQPPPMPLSHERKFLAMLFVRSKRGNCPAFKQWNLLITGFAFVDLIDMKRIDLSTVWLLVEVIVPTVFVLYVFSTASLRSESIVVTNLHWTLKKTIIVIPF